MKIIEISEDKIGKMSECAEKMLHYGGKLMQCLEDLEGGGYSEEGYGERGGYGYGERMGRRQRDWDEAPDMTRPPMQTGYRRGSNGRYM